MKLNIIVILAGLSITCLSGATPPSFMDKILNGLRKHGKMYESIQSVRVLSAFTGMYKSLLTFSPVFREIFEDLGKANPKYKVDLEIFGGHVPSMLDIYNLVTSRNAHVAFTSVLANNKHFQELTSLMNKTDFEHSKDDVERSIYLLTGHNVELKAGLFDDLTSDKGKINKSRDDKSRNLVIAVLCIHDIWNHLMDAFSTAASSNASAPGLLQIFSEFNYTRLNEISGLPLDGQKYSIGGQGTGGIDPEVSQIFQLDKAVKAKVGKTWSDEFDGEVLQGHLMEKLVDICNRALQQALSDSPKIVG